MRRHRVYQSAGAIMKETVAKIIISIDQYEEDVFFNRVRECLGDHT
jgi:hypothetical protein